MPGHEIMHLTKKKAGPSGMSEISIKYKNILIPPFPEKQNWAGMDMIGRDYGC